MAPRASCGVQAAFAAERVTESFWSEKLFDRTRRELSIGWQVDDIKLKWSLEIRFWRKKFHTTREPDGNKFVTFCFVSLTCSLETCVWLATGPSWRRSLDNRDLHGEIWTMAVGARSCFNSFWYSRISLISLSFRLPAACDETQLELFTQQPRAEAARHYWNVIHLLGRGVEGQLEIKEKSSTPYSRLDTGP